MSDMWLTTRARKASSSRFPLAKKKLILLVIPVADDSQHVRRHGNEK